MQRIHLCFYHSEQECDRVIFCHLRTHTAEQLWEGHPGTAADTFPVVQQPLAAGGCGRDRGNTNSHGGLQHHHPHLSLGCSYPQSWGSREWARWPLPSRPAPWHSPWAKEQTYKEPRCWAMTNAQVHFCCLNQEAVFRETPWLLDHLTHHLHLQPALLHPKSLAQLHLNNSRAISLLAMQTSWPKPNANHSLLPQYVLILLNCCNLQKYMVLFCFFFNPSPESWRLTPLRSFILMKVCPADFS